jgi:hypothetical protein
VGCTVEQTLFAKSRKPPPSGAILCTHPCREDHDRDVPRDRGGHELLQQGEPVTAREHDVEDDQVRALFDCEQESGIGVCCLEHLVSIVSKRPS